jgi:dienelactone hydrolase
MVACAVRRARWVLSFCLALVACAAPAENGDGVLSMAAGTLGGGGGIAGGGAGSSGGASGVGGGGGAGGMSGSMGCAASTLLPLPDDLKARGPWEVGVRTVTVGRLTAELMYPAEPGSTAGLPEVTYNLRDWLPPSEQSKVPDMYATPVSPIGGKLFRDVPIDGGHGPYPVVIMIHGTASMRVGSGSTNVHWASRGFVVIAADYPGLGLEDQLNGTAECGLPQTGVQDIPGDVDLQIAALEAASGDLAFLATHIDPTRLALSGHSQGACYSALLASLPNVQVVIPLTGSTVVSEGPSLKSIMWIAGMGDTVIGYDTALLGNAVCPANPFGAVSNVDGYASSPGQPSVKKRIVGITGGGHLMPSDLCRANSRGNNPVQESSADGVCGVDQAALLGLPALADCGTISVEAGLDAVNYASTAALEETLHCLDRSAQLDALRTNLPQVGDYQRDD